MLEKVQKYKEIQKKIEELETEKKALVGEILDLMPQEMSTMELSTYRIKRVSRLSIQIRLASAEALGAVKMQKVVDREVIKRLFKEGHDLPGVSEIKFIQVCIKEESPDPLSI
ncbi:MAG: hypothetical protein HYZ48_05140 [Chlamydiales bacterium]|nr:hypothetical protein [Chlamydiales bacterium]